MVSLSKKDFIALLISNDQQLYKHLKTVIRNEFGIHLLILNQKEVTGSRLLRVPLLILWDGRGPAKEGDQPLSWMRDHFQGTPIISIVSEDDAYSQLFLWRYGVAQMIQYKQEELDAGLREYFQALLADQEHHRQPDKELAD